MHYEGKPHALVRRQRTTDIRLRTAEHGTGTPAHAASPAGVFDRTSSSSPAVTSLAAVGDASPQPGLCQSTGKGDARQPWHADVRTGEASAGSLPARSTQWMLVATDTMHASPGYPNHGSGSARRWLDGAPEVSVAQMSVSKPVATGSGTEAWVTRAAPPLPPPQVAQK